MDSATNDKINAEKQKICDSVEEILEEYAPVINVKINTAIRGWSEDDVIIAEIDFTDSNGKAIFGSSFYLHYSEIDGVEISCGSIGKYNKTHDSQIDRLRMILNIWDNVEYIENKFAELLQTSDLFELQRYQKELEDKQRYNDLEATRNIANNLKIGDIITDFPIPEDRFGRKTDATITKIGPFRVTACLANGRNVYITLEDLSTRIFNGKVLLKGDLL